MKSQDSKSESTCTTKHVAYAIFRTYEQLILSPIVSLRTATTRDDQKHSRMAFTHIVVGAGSAGCIVAARIVDTRDFNVLLLEAGPDHHFVAAQNSSGINNAKRVPMKGQSEIFDSAIDWSVKISLDDQRSMYVPQAKLVGGGSSINGGTTLRNTIADSQEWTFLHNDAWDFESTCKEYEILESGGPDTNRSHPIVRTPMSQTGNIQKSFVESAQTMGFDLADDLNATGAEGVGPSPVCRRGDRRVSAAEIFIDPIRKAPNFTILADSCVDKIVISHGRAHAVVLTDGKAFEASDEIIICAGALFSPAILQRSGIGPSKLLEALDIPVLCDLPIGLNLSDHPCIPVVARPRKGAYQSEDYSLQWQARWSSTQHPRAIDLQLVCFSYLFVTADENETRGLAGTATGHVAGLGCNVNKPTSLGSVTIQTKNPVDQPLVCPNYLQTNVDRIVAREGVRCAYKIMTSSAMQEVVEEPLALTKSIVQDDDLLDAWIQQQYASTYHFSGTCRMASPQHGGVVDQSGRVYNIAGLRVADASVIPTVPACNTMWTTMMFASRIGRSISESKDVERRDVQSRLS